MMQARSRKDYLAVVEAGYALGPSEKDWVQGIADAARPIVDRGLGVIAYNYDASDASSLRIDEYAQAGGIAPLEANVRAFAASLPPAQAALFHSGSPPTQRLRSIFRTTQPRQESLARLDVHPVVVQDALGIRGHNPNGRGCVISAPCFGNYTLPNRTRAALDRVALHLAAAHRLRASGRMRELFSQADAIFSNRGKLEHLAEDARSEPVTLRQAADQRLLAQRLRAQEPERALEIWRALIAGRWSVVDHTDSDGKRFILARRNDVRLREPDALEPRERLVALYAAWGHSSKLIGYELGLSPATVSTLLKRALRKLRFGSQAELVSALGKQTD